ncbi:MAG: hypothetical protein CMJ64_15960 [Planctomycetaceae bacterium]|nr:hypothetical protein [Planctomycetaceae bacterium]
MNENVKTAVFAGVAVLLGCVWLVARPKDVPQPTGGLVNKVLFPELDDPSVAASLSIYRYDEELGQLHSFEVTKNGRTGVWTIPSNSDYPADAEDRIRDVATSLVGLKVLGIVTEDSTEHELFGVVKPEKGMSVGQKGIGMLVQFEDQKGKELASLVVGKPIKGSEGHRFARRPEHDIVFDIEIDPDRFSTKFEEWIEADLLGVNTLDVTGATIKDYSVPNPRITPQGRLLVDPERRFTADVEWNGTDNKWELGELVTYRAGSDEPHPSKLLDGEELNKDKLDELKNSLDDLKIVDVRRKPKGMRDGSKADADFLRDQEALSSLLTRGLYPMTKDGKLELLCASGELYVSMKDGYRYLLRFGAVAGTGDGDDDAKLNRYLLVTADVDESKFPLPELQEVPKKPDSADVPQPPAAEGDEPAEAAEEKATEENAEGEAAAEGTEEEKDESELEREIKRIEKENQRKQDEWTDNHNKAKEKVTELNARFAEWYYVVSEDVYKKLRLSRSDLIKESEATADEGTGLDAFRKLQSEGLPEKASNTEPAEN